MFAVALTVACVIFFALLNFHRGGGPFRINRFMKDKLGFALGRSQQTATIILLAALGGLHAFGLIPLVAVFGLATGWFCWALQGWGSYFDAGTNQHCYAEEPEVAWIDWILFLIFGPKWIPGGSAFPPRDKIQWVPKKALMPWITTFGFIAPDVVPSPTGQLRPFEWRQKRDLVGMFLRHTHSIYVFAFVAWLLSDPMWLIGVPVFATAVAIANWIVWTPRGLEIIRNIPDVFPSNQYWLFNFRNNPIAIHEVLTGIIWGIAFAVILTAVVGL